jgi:hypothetical protein
MFHRVIVAFDGSEGALDAQGFMLVAKDDRREGLPAQSRRGSERRPDCSRRDSRSESAR